GFFGKFHALGCVSSLWAAGWALRRRQRLKPAPPAARPHKSMLLGSGTALVVTVNCTVKLSVPVNVAVAGWLGSLPFRSRRKPVGEVTVASPSDTARLLLELLKLVIEKVDDPPAADVVTVNEP